jgi:hypothetical protein
MKAAAIIIYIFFSIHVHAQVNGYAQVTAISSTTLTIGTSNETYGTFAATMPVLIMQMQDNVIGSNTSNNSSFGTLSSIQSAGQYEIVHIASVTRSSGVITQIVLTSLPANTYNTGSNASIQLITFPLLGSPNFTTTSDISAVAWNGSIGGVVAFRVSGTLTLNHNITADNAGFRGGVINGGNAGSCDNTTFITAANENNANKGEGVYKATNSTYAAGRAKIINGGGGANSHNGGGGGGSNASAGGDGGKGYSCVSSAGGMGGATLYSLISSSRAFMGGGAGAGEANNSYNTTGGNGGGLIIINANQIATTGTGSALRISANGQTASDVGNDGAGGGGAGGSVLLKVNSWSVVATKTLTISANGGDGGNVGDPASHGGGGGGGQGTVIFSTATPSTNIITRTLNGQGGRNYTGGTFADDGAGSDNVAIFNNSSFALLAAKVVSFKGKKNENSNDLSWQVVNGSGTSYYEVQRSNDGTNFETVGKVQATTSAYSFIDHKTFDSDTYYRIIMHSDNGEIHYSSVVIIKAKHAPAIDVSLMPNPVREQTSLVVETEHASAATVRIMNSLGILMSQKNIVLNKGENTIPLNITANLQNGTYQVLVNAGGRSTSVKMLVRR